MTPEPQPTQQVSDTVVPVVRCCWTYRDATQCQNRATHRLLGAGPSYAAALCETHVSRAARTWVVNHGYERIQEGK